MSLKEMLFNMNVLRKEADKDHLALEYRKSCLERAEKYAKLIEERL